MTDEFDDFLAAQMQDPGFRAAYEADVRRLKRAWLGYRGRAYDSEYRRRLRARARRRR